MISNIILSQRRGDFRKFSIFPFKIIIIIIIKLFTIKERERRGEFYDDFIFDDFVICIILSQRKGRRR